MSILPGELKLYKSKVVNNLSSNGGRISDVDEIISGALANCFPHVLPEELLAGSNIIRKIFFKVYNDDDLTLYSSKFFLDAPTPADDWVVAFAGTQRDTVNDHPTPRIYGVAFITNNLSAGASSIIVEVEDESITGMFADGDEIIITDKATASSLAGNRELHVISGGPVVAGNQVTITIVGVLANNYLVASNTRVSSVIDAGDIACSVDNWVEDGSGTYDESTYPVLTDNLGTTEQTWTLEFSDATTFTVTGDVVGSVGSGVVGSNFAPLNPINSKPYFTLRSVGFGGAWTAADTIVFQTHPAAFPAYLNRVVPPSSTGQTGNRITPVLLGATA